MQRTRLILLTACVLVARPVLAQATADSTGSAFRRGQWGFDFVPSRYLAEAGVLRFSTPRRAWVVDGLADFDHQTTSGTAPSGAEQSARSIDVNARVGPRWYHTEYQRVVRFTGLGVTGGYSSTTQNASTPMHQETWSAGVYGELGLQYLFTPHLGLGVRGDVVASGTGARSTLGGSPTQHFRNYRLGLEPLQVIGSFYF